jgi:hypothetical protein
MGFRLSSWSRLLDQWLHLSTPSEGLSLRCDPHVVKRCDFCNACTARCSPGDSIRLLLYVGLCSAASLWVGLRSCSCALCCFAKQSSFHGPWVPLSTSLIGLLKLALSSSCWAAQPRRDTVSKVVLRVGWRVTELQGLALHIETSSTV